MSVEVGQVWQDEIGGTTKVLEVTSDALGWKCLCTEPDGTTHRHEHSSAYMGRAMTLISPAPDPLADVDWGDFLPSRLLPVNPGQVARVGDVWAISDVLNRHFVLRVTGTLESGRGIVESLASNGQGAFIGGLTLKPMDGYAMYHSRLIARDGKLTEFAKEMQKAKALEQINIGEQLLIEAGKENDRLIREMQQEDAVYQSIAHKCSACDQVKDLGREGLCWECGLNAEAITARATAISRGETSHQMQINDELRDWKRGLSEGRYQNARTAGVHTVGGVWRLR